MMDLFGTSWTSPMHPHRPHSARGPHRSTAFTPQPSPGLLTTMPPPSPGLLGGTFTLTSPFVDNAIGHLDAAAAAAAASRGTPGSASAPSPAGGRGALTANSPFTREFIAMLSGEGHLESPRYGIPKIKPLDS